MSDRFLRLATEKRQFFLQHTFVGDAVHIFDTDMVLDVAHLLLYMQ